ncbi:sialidase [Edaphobacter acidisoli]|uniref:exo-alpha-sialidase n=1 Tax=Edaphobacter acidisoli TaxID=2040573 RepID=A0A916W477_9BACT|nr:sialidase [Edaphobacter acidisoli]
MSFVSWKLAFFLAVVLCVCSLSEAAAQPQMVFANGTRGYSCFRIPAIVRTPRGTLLAFAEARKYGCGDFGDVRLVMRRSRNGGKTWGSIETVAEFGTLKAGNAAPVVDTMDSRYPQGRIFLVYTTENASESKVMQGKGARRVWYRTSVDDGTTWAAPVEITTSVKLTVWRAYATGPGHALELTEGPHAGRIVVAAYHSEGEPQPEGQSYAANAFFSDNHGATWHAGAAVNVPGSNESTTAEWPDGTVVMNSRDQSGRSRARIVSISKDGAQSWETTFVAHDLTDPVCEGSVIDYSPAKGERALLFSNAGDREHRWDLTLSVSKDGGRTWPKHTVLYAGPSAYSDIVLMPKRRLGILWELGNEGGIAFMVRKIAPLL